MTKGYGNSRDQAERNASINGIYWLKEHKPNEIKNLLANSQFSLSLKACFMQFSNLEKFTAP